MVTGSTTIIIYFWLIKSLEIIWLTRFIQTRCQWNTTNIHYNMLQYLCKQTRSKRGCSCSHVTDLNKFTIVYVPRCACTLQLYGRVQLPWLLAVLILSIQFELEPNPKNPFSYNFLRVFREPEPEPEPFKCKIKNIDSLGFQRFFESLKWRLHFKKSDNSILIMQNKYVYFIINY